MLKEGIIIGERYEIISRVGAGGMADVYKAMDHKLNRLVAVKVLKAEFRGDGSFVAKFRKEAQAAAGLTHPNIVNVYDVGEDRGLYYIVMELVEGITLKNYIDKKGKLSVKEATSIAIQVSLGLECAHNQGIVHRDVKPQNIIISVDGKVKLSDFGIAKAINSNTITANVMGSVHFSSPEQVRGGFADAKSDIYSLGITMYEMVTGRVPFDGDTTVAIAIKHLQEEIIPPSRYTPDLPYSLEQIILKCTQKNPERRYASIGLLIDDLKRSLIDPQGNFVQMTPLGTNSQVLPVAGVAKSGVTGNTTQAETKRVPSSQSVSQQTQKTQRYIPEEDDDDIDDDYEERRQRRAARNAKSKKSRSSKDSDAISSKLEKAITIGGFLIGAIIIIILIVVIGMMAGLFNNNSDTTKHTSETSQTSDTSEISSVDGVVVPDFRNRTLEEAQTLAGQYGLKIQQTGTQESTVYEEGKICAQNPDSGTKVDPEATIEVVVSSGSSKITVPSGLVNATQAEAETALGQLGLTATVELQSSDTVETGRVISVDPAEGTEVQAGSSVKLIVSKGKEAPAVTTFPLPEVAGYDQASASAILDSYGVLYTVVEVENSDTAEGIVLYTDPASGTEVQEGQTITMYVSVAPEETDTTDTDDDYWVYYNGFEQPADYDGGDVRIELVQQGGTSLVYTGPNPFEPYNYYPSAIEGIAGESTGTVNIYEYNPDTGAYDNLIGSIELDGFIDPADYPG